MDESKLTEKAIHKPKESEGLATEMLREESRRRFIEFVIMVILEAITIIGFLLYLNQYDFTSTVEQSGFYTFSDSNGNVISSDIDEAQMREILEIINGNNKGDEKQD